MNGQIQAYLIVLLFALLCFVDNCICLFVYKFSVCDNPVLSFEQVYWHHFSNSISSFHVSASHFGNSCSVSDLTPAKDYDSLKVLMMVSIFF